MPSSSISVGFFDLRLKHIDRYPELPAVLRFLDAEWIERKYSSYLIGKNKSPKMSFRGERGQILSTVSSQLRIAKAIADYHGEECCIIDDFASLVIYPEAAIERQRSVNDWPPALRTDGVGPCRTALERNIPSSIRANLIYGDAASPEQIALVEEELDTAFPEVLRELYAEFDGVWLPGPYAFDIRTVDRAFRNASEQILFLPLATLAAIRKSLEFQYGQYDPDFKRQIVRAIPVQYVEGGASFYFMSETKAWKLQQNRVGKWDHDGGPLSFSETLEEFLVDRGKYLGR
jgi:hypothetical protein